MRFTQKVAIAFKSFSDICVSANATETEIEKCNENQSFSVKTPFDSYHN